MPCWLISVMSEKICCTRMGARPSDGSSSSSRRGRDMSARPMASICCSPPDSEPPFWRQALPQPREQHQRLLHVLGALRGGAREATHLEVLEHRHPREDPATFRRMADARADQRVGRRVGDVLCPRT